MLSCFHNASVKLERVLELIQARLFMDKCQQDVTLTISSICTQPSLLLPPWRHAYEIPEFYTLHYPVTQVSINQVLFCASTHLYLYMLSLFPEEGRITTSQIESAAITLIKILQTTLFSHSSVRTLHLMLDQHHAPVRPPYPPQSPVPTTYPHPNPLSTSTHPYPHPHPLAIYSSPFLNSAKSLYPPSPSTTHSANVSQLRLYKSKCSQFQNYCKLHWRLWRV